MKTYECDICHAKVNDFAHWENGEPRSMYELKTIHEYDGDSYEGMIICQRCFGLLKNNSIKEDKQKGTWIYSPETNECLEHWTCSNCMHDIIETPRYNNRITGKRTDFAFCPYCGIRMEDCEVE